MQMMSLKKTSLGTLGCFLAMACGGDSVPVTVEIVTPTEGVEVLGTSVQVRLASEGVEIARAADLLPGAAHHHLFLDRDVDAWDVPIPVGAGVVHLGEGQTEYMLTDLQPGEHRLIAVLGDNQHVPLRPPVADTVLFTVSE